MFIREIRQYVHPMRMGAGNMPGSQHWHCPGTIIAARAGTPQPPGDSDHDGAAHDRVVVWWR